jgi:arylsulfatase A-like enzyme
MGYGDAKPFGRELCRIETPAMDRLAREGMRFTDAHSPNSVCVPTRVAIMTGRYAWRFGPPSPGGAWGFLGTRFPTTQFTLPKLLKPAGYRTAYIGKWHLGTKMSTVDGKVQGIDNVDYSQPIQIGPLQYGFDESFVLPGSLDMYPYAFVRNQNWVGKVTAKKGWSAFNRVGPAAEDFEDTKVLDTFTTEAEAFLARQSKQPDQPFFLYLALTAPHTPTSPSATFAGKSAIGIYGDFVMEVDHCIGRILASLDQHGLTEDTLVIVTSDHGPALYAGRRRKATIDQLRELEDEGHFARGPFRGFKFSIYEGAFRIPFLARWPAKVPASTTCRRLVGLHDLMGTFAQIIGRPLDDTQGPDSISFLPLLRSPTATARRKTMILQSVRAFAIRDADWKLAFCPGSGCPGNYGNRPKQDDAWAEALESFGRKPRQAELLQSPFLQLFDLRSDIGESHNVAPANMSVVADLHEQFRRTIESGRTRPGPRISNHRANIPTFTSVPKSAIGSQ